MFLDNLLIFLDELRVLELFSLLLELIKNQLLDIISLFFNSLDHFWILEHYVSFLSF